MIFNFEQPITTYELIAIILSAFALIIPFAKWIHNRFIKTLKIDFLPSQTITLYHNKSGSYISIGGVYESKNKATTIREISAKVVRKSDNTTLPLIWSSFPSPIFRRVGGIYENTFETAHPFKVDADTWAPAFIEFTNSKDKIEEKTDKILGEFIINSIEILKGQNDFWYTFNVVKSLPQYNEAKLALIELFFWKEGSYELTVTTTHSNGTFDKKYEFELSAEESLRMKNNIDNLLVIHINEYFKLPLPIMNSIRKDFMPKKDNEHEY